MQRPQRLTTALIAMASVLVGCDATYKDVTGEVAYSQLKGAVCIVELPLNAYGVTKTLEREKKTDLIVLSALSLAGPEFTFSTLLGTGTKLRVQAVRQCTNCPFETRTEYKVEVMPEPPQFVDKPVYLAAEPLATGHVSCKANKSAA